MTPEWKLFINFCVSPTIHVSWPIFAKIGCCEVAEKSSGIAYKKDAPTIIITATTGWRSTWITSSVPGWTVDSTMWLPSAWSAFKQPARTNNDVEGWHAHLNSRANHGQMNMYQQSAAVPSPRGSRPRKHWCPSAVKCGHLSVAAEKVYTSPQPPVQDVG